MVYEQEQKNGYLDDMDTGHLLIVTPGFALSEQDTTCMPAVQQFIKSYRENFPEIKITILALHYPFEMPVYTWYDMPVYSMLGKNKNGYNRLLTICKTIWKGIQINGKSKVTAVLALWLTDTALAGKYISKFTGAPMAIWMHGQDARAGNKYVKMVNPEPEQLMAISAYQNNILKLNYDVAAAHVVNNGLYTSIFPPLKTANRSIDILAVGSLIPLKQNHLFIELVQKIKSKGFPDIKAVLVGEGILDLELRNYINSTGLQDNITVIPKLSHSEVLQLMNDAHIFVHPSSYEGHSTVMLEALYSGCKVFSFIPAADNGVPNFTLCKDLDEMFSRCIVQIHRKQDSYIRVLVQDMHDSAKRIQNILKA